MEQNSKSMDTEPASEEAAGPASVKAGTAQGGTKPDKRGATQSAVTQNARASRVSSRSANNAFLGRRLRGRCQLTVAGGQVAFRLVDVGVPA